MKSEDLKAFDLTAESPHTREKYGRNNFGQGCLLARRLVESGVRLSKSKWVDGTCTTPSTTP